MLRLAALTALLLSLVTYSRAEAQEGPLGVHTPSKNLEAHITQIEIQVKLSKLKKLFEEIADHELTFAKWRDHEDSEQTRAFVAENQKQIERLRVESDKTRDQISQLAKVLPQGYSLQLTSSLNRPLSPDQAAQKLNSDLLTNSALKKEMPQQRLAVQIEFTKAQLITELLWGVLREEDRASISADDRTNLIILTGEKEWTENAHKLIETLNRCGLSNIKASQSK